MCSGKDKTEQGEINKEVLDEISLIIKALTVICLNVENSPLVGSMDFASHVTQLNTMLLQQLLEMESAFFSARCRQYLFLEYFLSPIFCTILKTCQ